MKSKLIVILMFFLLFPMFAYSAGKTWTFWGSGNWSDPSKWNPTGVPASTDDIVIPYDNPDPMTITMDIAGGVTIASLYMDGGDEFPYVLNLQGNINVLGNVTLSLSQTISLNSYNAVMKGNVSISGTVNSSTGELQIAGTGAQSLYVNAGTADIRISNTSNTILLSTLDSVCKNFTIDSGAVLNQDTRSLTLSGNITADGTYIKGTGILAFMGGSGVKLVSVSNNQNLGKVSVFTTNTTVSLLNSANFTNITIASGTVFKGNVAGTTVTIDNTSYISVNKGSFLLTGADGNNIVLKSDAGAQFDFKAVSGSTVTLSYASVLSCDASGGIAINATDHCTNLGGNTNVNFFGAKTWINTNGGNWSDPANWNPTGVPYLTTEVYLPYIDSHEMTITMDIAAGTTIKSLTVEDAQTQWNDNLNLNGNLQIEGNLSIGGFYIVNLNNYTAKVKGNVEIYGDSYITASSGELQLIGTQAQSLFTYGVANIRISNTSATVSLATYSLSSKNLIIDTAAVLAQGSYGVNVAGDLVIAGTYLKGTGTLTFNNGTIQSVSVLNSQNLGKVSVSTVNTAVSLLNSAKFDTMTVASGTIFKSYAAGTTITVDNTSYVSVNKGSFLLTGADGNNIVLKSDAGAQFDFKSVSGSTVTLSYVSLLSCDASGGIKINATDHCTDLGGNTNIDWIAPSAITDLSASTVIGAGGGKISLTWTAVGDDTTSGTASGYVVKYSNSPITTELQFNAASAYTQSWSAVGSGDSENKTLSGLAGGITYYISIKAKDSSGGLGGLSNNPNAVPASARTWNNSSGGIWSNASNWSPSGVPISADDVYIPFNGDAITISMDIANGVTVASLTMDGDSQHSHTLNLSGNMEITGSLTMYESQSINMGSCTVTVKGNIVGYEINSTTGELNIAGTQSQSLSSSGGSSNIRISNTSGTVSLSGALGCKNLVIEPGAVLNQGTASITITGNMIADGTYLKGTGSLNFSSGSIQPISVSNNQNLGKVYVLGTNTTVSLLSSAKFSFIYIANGTTLKDTAAGTTLTIDNTAGITLLLGNFVLSGTSGNNIVLQSDSAGNQFSFVRVSTDGVTLSYVSIKDCSVSNYVYEINAQNNCTDLGNNINIDFYPPGAITNLSAGPGYSVGAINLTWTAVGDDTTTGTATSYVVKYSNSPITTEALFSSATLYSPYLGNPLGAGGSESKTLSGLSIGITYYISVKAQDNVAGLGALSNSAYSMPYDGAKTWNGAAGLGDWASGANWLPAAVPESLDNIIINKTNSIVTNASGSINSFTIGTSNSCTLQGGALTVLSPTSGISVGIVGFINSSSFDIKGNMSATHSTLSVGTLLLSGNTVQTLKYPGSITSSLTISNTSAIVTLNNSAGSTLSCINIAVNTRSTLQINSQTIKIAGHAAFSGIVLSDPSTKLIFQPPSIKTLTANNNSLGNIILPTNGSSTTLVALNSLTLESLTIGESVRFLASTPGATFSFSSANGVTVENGGAFVFTGSYDNRSIFKKATETFNFNLANEGKAKFAYVDIYNCDASSGTTVYVPPNCMISNTQNITVLEGANAKLWTGASNNSWNEANNWNPIENPASYDDIVIQNGSVNGASGMIASLTLDGTVALTLTSLTVNGGFAAGNASYIEGNNLYVKGNVSGTNVGGVPGGTLYLNGSSWQSVNWGGQNWDISVRNTSAYGVSASGDVQCLNFILEDNIKYAQGNYHLSIAGNSIFNPGVNFTQSSPGNVSVGGNLYLDGDCSFGNNLYVTGNLIVSGGTCALGGGNTNVNGRFDLNSGVFNQGASSFSVVEDILIKDIFNEGSGTITFTGLVIDITTGKFNKGTGTMRFAKGSLQKLNANNNDLGNVGISSSNTVVSLTNSAKFSSFNINDNASIVCRSDDKAITIGNATINGRLDFFANRLTLLVMAKPDNGITVNSTGRLNLLGASGVNNYAAFLSAQPGAQFKVTTASTDNVSIKYANIRDCDASYGEQIEGIASVDLGNNNYVFFGAQPPAPINNIQSRQTAGSGDVEVKWTAVGTEGNSGRAKEYIVKYSSVNITTQEQFESSQTYIQSWVPKKAGENESYNLTGLPSGTDIWFVSIEAKNFTGLQGDVSSISEFIVQINPSRSVAYSLPGERGNVNIEVPAGAFSQNVEITGKELSSSQMPSVNEPEFKGTGLGASFSVSTAEKFKQPLKLKIKYETKDIEGLNENKLRIAFYNEAMGKWFHIKSNVDSVKKTVNADLKHLTTFRVVEYTYLGLSTVKVFPSPWKLGKGNSYDAESLTFKNLPEKGRIRIYNVAGEMAKDITITEADYGFCSWNGTNDAGRKVSSGVYMAYVEDNEGNHRIVKIAIIR